MTPPEAPTQPAPWLLEPVDVVPMTAADIDELMVVERLCFRTPWSAQVFLEELDREYARIDVIRRLRDGAILGFVNYWLVADEVHLLNVAVHPAMRRRGHAQRLLQHVFEKARQRGAKLMTLEVRRSNEAAQRLYAGFGFTSVGVRPQYYADDLEDALVMVRRL